MDDDLAQCADCGRLEFIEALIRCSHHDLHCVRCYREQHAVHNEKEEEAA